jgi:hypothetical protein
MGDVAIRTANQEDIPQLCNYTDNCFWQLKNECIK